MTPVVRASKAKTPRWPPAVSRSVSLEGSSAEEIVAAAPRLAQPRSNVGARSSVGLRQQLPGRLTPLLHVPKLEALVASLSPRVAGNRPVDGLNFPHYFLPGRAPAITGKVTDWFIVVWHGYCPPCLRKPHECLLENVVELRKAGFRYDEIGVISPQGYNGETKIEAGAAVGAVAGGTVGAVAGALATGLLPGVGPDDRDWAIGGVLGGAAAGAAAGMSWAL